MEIYDALARARGRGDRVVLVTVLTVEGDASSHPGAKLVVGAGGVLAGTLGCSEFDTAGIALAADEDRAGGDDSLRMSFLALELRRIERDLRRAREAGDFEEQGRLALAKRRVFDDMGTVMGQTT